MKFERRALCQGDKDYQRNPVAVRNKIKLLYDLDPLDFELEDEDDLKAPDGLTIIGTSVVISTPAAIDTKSGEIMAAGDQESVIESLAANSDNLPFSVVVTRETTFENPDTPTARFDLLPLEVDSNGTYHELMSAEALENIQQTFRLLGQDSDSYNSR